MYHNSRRSDSLHISDIFQNIGRLIEIIENIGNNRKCKLGTLQHRKHKTWVDKKSSWKILTGTRTKFSFITYKPKIEYFCSKKFQQVDPEWQLVPPPGRPIWNIHKMRKFDDNFKRMPNKRLDKRWSQQKFLPAKLRTVLVLPYSY